MRRLSDGEREILAELERDARPCGPLDPDADDLPTEAEWDERAAGYDWPAELDMDPDPEFPW